MSRHVQPYVGATVEAMASGLIPEGPNVGRPVTVTLYRDVASRGTTPVRWYEVCAPECQDDGRPWRQCWRFTGKHYAEAARLFARDLAELRLTVNVDRREVSNAQR